LSDVNLTGVKVPTPATGGCSDYTLIVYKTIVLSKINALIPWYLEIS
jgi:hypothetical protein